MLKLTDVLGISFARHLKNLSCHRFF